MLRVSRTSSPKCRKPERYFVVSGRHTGSQGTTFLKLKPWGERKRTQLEIIIISALALEMTAIPRVVAFPSNPPRSLVRHPLQARWRAIRGDRQGRRYRTLQPGRSVPHLMCAAAATRRSMSQLDDREGVRGAEGAGQLQSAPLGDDHRAPRSWLHPELRARPSRESCKGGAAAHGPRRLLGQSREFKQTSASIYFTFLLALAFIYLVLAAQSKVSRTP